MKIEKISDTQVKFVLTKADLEEHGIQITELAYGSEKTHRLFQEMMRQAHMECAFEAENTPLMVEAMPVGQSHVVIVVTKVAGTGEEGKPPLNLFPQGHPNAHSTFNNQNVVGPVREGATAEPPYQPSGLSIFSFLKLDDTVLAAKRLHNCFMGQSRLYRCDNHYFLTVQEDVDEEALLEAEIVLFEYGEKHVSSSISENYLREHGEIMIEYQAIEKLAWYL